MALQEEIVLKKLGLHIPQEAATFEDFKAQMKLSEEDFKARLIALTN